MIKYAVPMFAISSVLLIIAIIETGMKSQEACKKDVNAGV
jgi:hypothetical protein